MHPALAAIIQAVHDHLSLGIGEPGPAENLIKCPRAAQADILGVKAAISDTG